MSSKSQLILLFEQGDVPSGSNFADMINSSVNMFETATQTMLGALNPTEIITARVSATNVVVTGTLSVAGVMSASNLTLDRVSASAATIAADVSAGGTVYASAMRSGGFIGTTNIVSAAGTTQATAAPLTFVVNRGKGVADGQTTGYTPLANRPGLVQYLFNEGASANLWPVVGGTINGLAVNAAFPLAASAMVTIVHLTASAHAVTLEETKVSCQLPKSDKSEQTSFTKSNS